MKLVVALGNPGAQYAGTRHNLGFKIADAFASRHGLKWEKAPRQVNALVAKWRSAETIVAKPQTFMNLGGPAVVGLLQFFKIEIPALFVIVDEVNLELGRLRARPRGSAGGHNGLKSIIEALGTNEFSRLRVGVGRGDKQRDLAQHVLNEFEPSEQSVIADATTRAVDALEMFVEGDIDAVMNRFNRRNETQVNGKEDGE